MSLNLKSFAEKDGGVLVAVWYRDRQQHWPDVTMKKFIEALDKYIAGAKIQDAFNFIDADRREFLMTGITGEEWEEMWSDEE